MGNLATVEVSIDCAPGAPRPDAYIPDVADDLGVKYGEPISKFFGNWTWWLENVDKSQYEQKLEGIMKRANDLYARGRIRYFSIKIL